MSTQDIVQKLWNLCNVLRDDGITYHQYVTELTYILFLKMADETGADKDIPEAYRWGSLTSRSGIDLKNPEVLNPYFLSYQAGSRYGKAYFLSCSKQTTNLASINSTQLKNFPVLIPSMMEQEVIIRLLDSSLEKEQQTKNIAESVLDQIDLMKKSILARAFRGELGTNDPSEESAVGLLKRTIL